jgi:multidrug resistance efflux pump
VTHRIYSLAECAELARIVPRRPPISVIGIAVILATLVTTAIVWAALTDVDLVVRGPARVRARVAPRLAFASTSGEQVYAPSAGRVARVAVTEGQVVAAGDELVALDTTALANDLARFESAVAAARSGASAAKRTRELAAVEHDAARTARAAELAQAIDDEKHDRRRSRADARRARAALEDARREADRLRALESDGAASQRQVDAADAAAAGARAELDAASVGAASRVELLRSRSELAEREWAVRDEELGQRVEAAAAELAAAERVAANARLELERATIRAAVAGTVTAVAVAASDPVQPGQPVVAVAPAGGMRVDAAVAASDIADLRVGMPVRIRLDAFDWQQCGTLAGTIGQIGTDAELLGPDGGKVSVYVVRVDLAGDRVGRGVGCGAIKLGMTGTVEVVTGTDRLLSLVFGRIRRAVAL